MKKEKTKWVLQNYMHRMYDLTHELNTCIFKVKINMTDQIIILNYTVEYVLLFCGFMTSRLASALCGLLQVFSALVPSAQSTEILIVALLIL